MPQSRPQQKQSLAEAQAWIADIENDPDVAAQGWDASDLRRIVAARTTVETARDELAEAVRAARANGRPWQLIAIPLGISRQAAREQYGE